MGLLPLGGDLCANRFRGRVARVEAVAAVSDLLHGRLGRDVKRLSSAMAVLHTTSSFHHCGAKTIMFKINQGKGFSITFDNGYTVSVQFGPGNYCSNHTMVFHTMEDMAAAGKKGSNTAETAIIDRHGNFVRRFDNDYEEVQAFQTPAQVLGMLMWAENLGRS